jgi:hypothetical protein
VLSLVPRLMFGLRALSAASPSLRRVLVSQSAANRLFSTASQTPKFSWEAGLTDNFSTKLASKAAQGVFSKQLDALAADGFEHDPFNVHQVRGAPLLLFDGYLPSHIASGRHAAAVQTHPAASGQR